MEALLHSLFPASTDICLSTSPGVWEDNIAFHFDLPPSLPTVAQSLNFTLTYTALSTFPVMHDILQDQILLIKQKKNLFTIQNRKPLADRPSLTSCDDFVFGTTLNFAIFNLPDK